MHALVHKFCRLVKILRTGFLNDVAGNDCAAHGLLLKKMEWILLLKMESDGVLVKTTSTEP